MTLHARDDLDTCCRGRYRLVSSCGSTRPLTVTRRRQEALVHVGDLANGEVQLPPLAVLRDRGVLERTIRQQLVHLLVDDQLKSRPRWVRDGAAMYFADQSGDAAPQSDADARARMVQPVRHVPATTSSRVRCPPGRLTNAWHVRARVSRARWRLDGRGRT